MLRPKKTDLDKIQRQFPLYLKLKHFAWAVPKKEIYVIIRVADGGLMGADITTLIAEIPARLKVRTFPAVKKPFLIGSLKPPPSPIGTSKEAEAGLIQGKEGKASSCHILPG